MTNLILLLLFPNEIIMSVLSRDILGLVLAYGDNFRDYCNWSLVGKEWHDKIRFAIPNILCTILNNDIKRMVNKKEFDRVLVDPSQMVNNQFVLEGNNINTLFFIYWGSSSIITQIDYYVTSGDDSELVHEMKKEADWTTDHAYWYGSKMPNYSSVGYVCVRAVSVDIDKIVFHFNGFNPILIAVN